MEKENYDYKYIFGPVPSRRLGFSLGIDVVPFKKCSYDCIYCQLGKTTCKTISREEFVPVKEVMKELKRKLSRDIRIDYITLSGSGEPTLYAKLDELVSGIKNLTGIPLALLTNGSLLWDPDIQRSVKKTDLVIPSLDAGNEDIFNYVNRPHKDLSFNKVVEGIIEFSSNYKNKIWLEVFLLDGVTSIRSEIMNLDSIIRKIKPHKIQLNTVKRPPAESFAFAIPEEQMRTLAGYFKNDVEIIADFKSPLNKNYFTIAKEEIINLLKRRPCSLNDISGVLNLHKNEVLKYTDELIKNNTITSYDHNHTVFYSIKHYSGEK
ncbi:MAG: radical SAM protein [Spirochaetales bacterium]|nr:radical SAM protein [Spirochaetales bacterium]